MIHVLGQDQMDSSNRPHQRHNPTRHSNVHSQKGCLAGKGRKNAHLVKNQGVTLYLLWSLKDIRGSQLTCKAQKEAFRNR